MALGVGGHYIGISDSDIGFNICSYHSTFHDFLRVLERDSNVHESKLKPLRGYSSPIFFRTRPSCEKLSVTLCRNVQIRLVHSLARNLAPMHDPLSRSDVRKKTLVEKLRAKAPLDYTFYLQLHLARVLWPQCDMRPHQW